MAKVFKPKFMIMEWQMIVNGCQSDTMTRLIDHFRLAREMAKTIRRKL